MTFASTSAFFFAASEELIAHAMARNSTHREEVFILILHDKLVLEHRSQAVGYSGIDENNRDELTHLIDRSGFGMHAENNGTVGCQGSVRTNSYCLRGRTKT